MPDPVNNHVRLTKLIRAPRERVFDAWLDPDIRRQWWCGGPGMSCPFAEIDANVGGNYRVAMCKEDKEWVTFGEFVEIDRPEKLVFTWTWEHDPSFGGDSRVTVTLHETTFDDKPATELVLLHEKLASPHERSEHTVGWGGALGNLANLFTKPGDTPTEAC